MENDSPAISDDRWVDVTVPPFTQFISYAEFKSDGTYHSWGALGVAH